MGTTEGNEHNCLLGDVLFGDNKPITMSEMQCNWTRYIVYIYIAYTTSHLFCALMS